MTAVAAFRPDSANNGKWLKTVGGAFVWSPIAAADVAGLGGAALLNVGTTPGTVAAGDDARFSGGGGGTLEALEGIFDSRNTAYSGGAKADLRHVTAATTASSTTVAGTFLAANADAGKLVMIEGAGTVLLTNTNGTMTNAHDGNQNRLTGSGFTQALVGRYISVTGIGSAGATKTGYVLGVTDSTHLYTSFDCNTTVSGTATYTISEHLYTTATASTTTTLTVSAAPSRTIASADVYIGTDDAPAIQACINAAEAAAGSGNGYTVYLHGAHALGSGLLMTLPGHLMGEGSPGYSKFLGFGSTRLQALAPISTVLTVGSSTTKAGAHGNMTSGSAVLTDSEANFVAGDVGKPIYVWGAYASHGSDFLGVLETTIASRQSATQVTLAATATKTAVNMPYSLGGTQGSAFSGPNFSRIHIVGNASSKVGCVIHGSGGCTFEHFTVSDFVNGIGLIENRGGGFNNNQLFYNTSWNNCQRGIVGFGSDLEFVGYNNMDGTNNRVDLHPGSNTIGLMLHNTSIRTSGNFNIQSTETWGQIDGSGQTNMEGCRGEGCLSYLTLGTDSDGDITNLTYNGARGSSVRFWSMDTTSLGVSHTPGLKLLSGIKNFTYDPGLYIEGDIDMYGQCDATSLANTRIPQGQSIVKAGAISDGDFLHPPQDGAIGIDTLNGHIEVRSGGVWKYASLTGAASRVKKIKDFQNQSAATTLVLTCPVGMTTVPAGHHVVVAYGYGLGSTPTVTVADSKGNTYTVNIHADLTTGNAPHAGIATAIVTTPLVAGDTITITFGGSSPGLSDAIAYEYAGLAPSSWIDGTSIGATGTSTSPSSGNDTTTQASDILLSVTYEAAATATAGTGWTILDSIDNVGLKRIVVQEKPVFATGTYAGTLTLGSSVDWASVITALKAA
jgi:hypothetical protein